MRNSASQHADFQRRSGAVLTTIAMVIGLAGAALADPLPSTSPPEIRPTLNFNGVPGLIEMPSGQALPDGEMTANLSSFAGFTRATLNWQITPRLSGAFRYSVFNNLNFSGFEDYYDRSFDVRYQLLWESRFLPAVAVGLQDFAGTGLYAGEYIVATKTLTPKLTVTAGLGWGRYGTYNSIASPLGNTRPAAGGNQGGQLSYDTWFRGPMAAFGGVEWRPNDKLGFKLEYSSDAYGFEAGTQNRFDRKSPFNFGVEYQVTDGVRLGAYALYGDTIGLNATIAMNPRRPASPRVDLAPRPVALRPDRNRYPQVYAQDWVGNPAMQSNVRASLEQTLSPEGQKLLGIKLEGQSARVWVENQRHMEPAAAAGRIARAMAETMPGSVEAFQIVLMRNGVPASTLTLQRSDLERLEAEPSRAEDLLERAQFTRAAPLTRADQLPGVYPRFNWRLLPYTQTSYFDPQSPLLIQAGVRARASFEFTPGLILRGSVAKRLGGNLDEARLSSTGKLPVVRTDWPLYYQGDEVKLENLTLSYATNLGNDVYGRVSAGYFERMYGGVSAEVLWKPVASRLAVGAEINHVRKRDPNQALGFLDYETTMGHVSAYYEMKNGYSGQLDVGRYLAGDLGATLTLSREFANGWKISAFATKTNVSAADFGEGSFDKGVRFEIPLSWGTGKASRRSLAHSIKPVQRDGGARLAVGGRLYETVRDGHRERYEDGWPLVWR